MSALRGKTTSTMWRVVHARVNLSCQNPMLRGPWHEDRKHIDSWARWFRELGQDAWTQSSNGEIWDGQQRLKARAA